MCFLSMIESCLQFNFTQVTCGPYRHGVEAAPCTPGSVCVLVDSKKQVLAFQTSLGVYFFPKDELAENRVRSGVDVSSKLPK